MMATIKDYLLTVLVRMIIGYVLLVFFAIIMFMAYALVYGWGSAISLASRIAINDFARIVMWLPFFLAWFSDKRKGEMLTDKMSFAEKQLLGFYE